MGAIGPVIPLDSPIDDSCDCLWGQNKCPNEAARIVKNTMNAGFSVMCETHFSDFQQEFPDAPVMYLPYDRDLVERLTEEAKAAGLV